MPIEGMVCSPGSSQGISSSKSSTEDAADSDEFELNQDLEK